MSQEELSGSVSQLEVSLSSYYNSRVICAAERRCYCDYDKLIEFCNSTGKLTAMNLERMLGEC